MPGIRIQHPTRRNERFNFEDPSRPYPRPFHCPPPDRSDGCGRTHLFKAVHVVLDETGAAVVAVPIWERYGHLFRAHGFRPTNEVAKPPDQRVVIPSPLVIRLRSLLPGARHAD